MRTVKEIKELNSETGSGQKNTDFLGLKALFRFLGGRKNVAKLLVIQKTDHGFYVEDRNGDLLAGPYKREADAKGVRTRIQNKHIG